MIEAAEACKPLLRREALSDPARARNFQRFARGERISRQTSCRPPLAYGSLILHPLSERGASIAEGGRLHALRHYAATSILKADG